VSLHGLFHLAVLGEAVDLGVLLGEEVACAADPAVGPAREALHRAHVVAVEDAEVVVGEVAQVLLAVDVGLAFLDRVDEALVVELGHELVAHEAGRVVGVVVDHDGDVDRLADGLVVEQQLVLVGGHVPGGYGHDAVSSRVLRGLGHLDDVLGPVGSGGAHDLDAPGRCLDGGLVDGRLLCRCHGHHLAGAARGDDPGDAVGDEEVCAFLDAVEVD